MLLEAILKHSQRAGLVEEAAALEQAFHVMTVVPNQANDMMDIGRLQGFEVGSINKNNFLSFRGWILRIFKNIPKSQSKIRYITLNQGAPSDGEKPMETVKNDQPLAKAFANSDFSGLPRAGQNIDIFFLVIKFCGICLS